MSLPIMIGIVAIIVMLYIAGIFILMKEGKKNEEDRKKLEAKVSEEEKLIKEEEATKKKIEEQLSTKEKELGQKDELFKKEVATEEKLKEDIKALEERIKELSQKNLELSEQLVSKETLYNELKQKYETPVLKAEEPEKDLPLSPPAADVPQAQKAGKQGPKKSKS